MNSPAYFELQADNPERLIAFYETVFDWQFEKQEGLPVDYWRITTTGIAGGLNRRPVPIPGRGGTNAAVISMEVEDYDATEKLILDKGGIVAMEKFPIPGRCWQGYYLDTDGNTFGIFEADIEAK